MAFYDTNWYLSSVAYAAVTARPQNTAVAAGVVRRQFTTPSAFNERCFVSIVAGTTANVTDATWVLTRGAKTTDGTVTWQECTGASAVNGDAASTPTWATAKATGNPTLGAIIKRNNGASYQICSTAGTLGASEPSFSDTAGVTTTDNTAVWTSLGVVGNFPAWGAPFARLTQPYTATWGVAGNKFWVKSDHAETFAGAVTYTSPATAAGGPTYTICVNSTTLPPVEADYTTGATITTTGAADLILQTTAASFGTCFYQGIQFSGGSGASASGVYNQGAGSSHVYRNCAFICPNTTANGGIIVGDTTASGAPSNVLWDNCWVQFGNASHAITPSNVNFEWRNTASAVHGATLPSSLFTPATSRSSFAVCRGVDLSAVTGNLVSPKGSSIPIVFEDCKLNASVTKLAVASAFGYASDPVITVRCDSGATNYKASKDEYTGVQTVETSITRVGGATDGTTATSDKIITNTQATFLTPFRMLPLAIWNDVTGADVVVTVYGTINSASLPTDGELWMDLQYLGSSGSPVASFKSTAKSHPLATAANVSSDGSTWNGGGSGAGWSPFKLTATLTSPQPQMKGYIYINVRAGKASSTYYLDPQPVLS